MVYPEVIHGRFVDLRSITLDDADFSYNIRADKRNRDTVGQLAETVEDQRKFIEWQMQEPDDYYFVVLNKQGERIGLYGVYDIHDGMAEVGREVNIGEPIERVEVGPLVAQFCHDVLHLKKIYFVVYSNKTHHISHVKKVSTYVKTVVRGGHEALYYECDLSKTTATSDKIQRLLNKFGK